MIPPDPFRPDQVTHGPEWAALRSGMRAAVSAYVTRLQPRPGMSSPLRYDPAELRSRYLLTLATERAAAEHLERLAVVAGQWAIHYGATVAELAAVDGTTAERAARRYAIPDAYRGQKHLPQRPDWVTETDETDDDPDSHDASAG